jgi:putative peptide zinc metalloprotease protein
LRSHARIHRHHYRGELWYVLEDRVSRKMHRFNPAAYYIVGLLDGRRTVHEIWEAATERFGDDAPTQDEVIRLLGQLHTAEVLQSEAMPDLTELARRARKGKRKTWLQNLLSPLAIRSSTPTARSSAGCRGTARGSAGSARSSGRRSSPSASPAPRGTGTSSPQT